MQKFQFYYCFLSPEKDLNLSDWLLKLKVIWSDISLHLLTVQELRMKDATVFPCGVDLLSFRGFNCQNPPCRHQREGSCQGTWLWIVTNVKSLRCSSMFSAVQSGSVNGTCTTWQQQAIIYWVMCRADICAVQLLCWALGCSGAPWDTGEMAVTARLDGWSTEAENFSIPSSASFFFSLRFYTFLCQLFSSWICKLLSRFLQLPFV